MVIRSRYLARIDAAFNVLPIIILIGARQVGKTSLMKMYPFSGASLFVNGQDPEVSAIFQKLSDLESYLKAYLNPEIKGLLLIDEFQFIPGISTMLKVLSDKNESLKILCSGSSSIDIQQVVEESLAGRLRVIEVLSLSFEEYLLFKDNKLHKLYSGFDLTVKESAFLPQLLSLMKEYLLYGGFPRAALTDSVEQKLAILDDIYKTYLIRDVRSYIKNEHFLGFNKMLRLLAAQTSNIINVNELSRESGLPYRTSEEYLDLLQQMYIIKLIEPFSTNKRSVITKMKKVFFNDLGLRNIINTSFQDIDFRADNGALFENFVFQELWRNLLPSGKIYYYRTKDGAEVDFVIEQPTNRYAVECKFSNLERPIGVRTLKSFAKNEGISNLYLINQNLNTDYDQVRFIQGYFTGFIFQR